VKLTPRKSRPRMIRLYAVYVDSKRVCDALPMESARTFADYWNRAMGRRQARVIECVATIRDVREVA
jgi:hypothetical protein